MRIAIIIPCRDRARSLARCLQSIQAAARRLGNAAHPAAMPALRTVVVSDRSQPGFAARIMARFPWAEVIDAAGIGPGAARNTGIRHTRADHYLFTDSDCVVDGDWLLAAWDWCQNGRTLVAQGVPWLHQLRQNPPLGHNEQQLYRLLFGSYIRGGSCHQIDTRNFIIAREAVELLDGTPFTSAMSEAQSESRVLAGRLLRHAIAIAWVPRMKVYHEDPPSLESCWMHKYRHGGGRRYVWDHPPPAHTAMHRYFVAPVMAGLDPDYVVPAHIAFLTGYRDALEDPALHRAWWPQMYAALLDHFPDAGAHCSAVESSLAPIRAA